MAGSQHERPHENLQLHNTITESTEAARLTEAATVQTFTRTSAKTNTHINTDGKQQS